MPLIGFLAVPCRFHRDFLLVSPWTSCWFSPRTSCWFSPRAPCRFSSSVSGISTS